MTPCIGDVGHLPRRATIAIGAREVAGGDAPLEHRVDALEPLARQADGFGIGCGVRRRQRQDRERGRRNDD